MIKIKEKYVTDKKGKAVSIVLDIKEYRKLLKQSEELEAIRAFDAAKSSCDESLTFKKAIEEIEKHRS